MIDQKVPYEAIGRFIVACSELETYLRDELADLVEAQRPVFNALVGKPRFVDLINMLRAVAKTRLLDDDYQRLNEILEHVDYINKVRSVVAHRAPIARDGTMIFFSTWASRNSVKSKAYKCTEGQLKACASFIGLIGLWFGFYRSDREMSKDAQEIREKLRTLQRTPELPEIPTN